MDPQTSLILYKNNVFVSYNNISAQKKVQKKVY